jgi:hypothetical protein
MIIEVVKDDDGGSHVDYQGTYDEVNCLTPVVTLYVFSAS